MDCTQTAPCDEIDALPSVRAAVPATTVTGATTAALVLESCGGAPSPSAPAALLPTEPVFRTTEVAAARFLGQATMGASTATITQVREQGFDRWLTEQLAMTRGEGLWDRLVAGGHNIPGNINNQTGFDPAIWSQLITAPDQLRQRVGMALLDFLVVGISGLPGNFQQFSAAAYIDVLPLATIAPFSTRSRPTRRWALT